jgi:hypothetical protein
MKHGGETKGKPSDEYLFIRAKIGYDSSFYTLTVVFFIVIG